MGEPIKKKLKDPVATLGYIQDPVREELQEVRLFIRDILIREFDFAEEVAEHVTSMKGKLFRPTLLLLSGNLNGGPRDPGTLVTMAVVVEMIHTATLVHDDFIDNASIRRGLQTLNDRWNDQVSVIMGDYLYSRSLVEMVRVGNIDVMRIIAESARRIALGEMMELNYTNSIHQTEAQYYETISHKTAALISASCESGAVLSDSPYRKHLREYGEHLGMAFQIVDDVFDYTGRTNVIGKRVGTDLRERKATLPLIYALEGTGPSEKRFIEELFAGDRIEPEDVEKVTRIIETHGGFSFSSRKAREYAEKARAAIGGIEPSRYLDSLHDTIDYVIERDR